MVQSTDLAAWHEEEGAEADRKDRRRQKVAVAQFGVGNFLRTLATPEPIKEWSLTSLKEKLIKIGANAVSHGR